MRLRRPGPITGLVVLAALVLSACGGGGTADLSALISEPVWSRPPPGGEQVWSNTDAPKCDWMGDLMEIGARFDVPDVETALEHYTSVLGETGWSVVQRDSGNGLDATKGSEGRVMILWVSVSSYEGTPGVEVRGTIEPDGC